MQQHLTKFMSWNLTGERYFPMKSMREKPGKEVYPAGISVSAQVLSAGALLLCDGPHGCFYNLNTVNGYHSSGNAAVFIS